MVTPSRSTMSSSCFSCSSPNNRDQSRIYRFLGIALTTVLIVVLSFNSSSSFAQVESSATATTSSNDAIHTKSSNDVTIDKKDDEQSQSSQEEDSNPDINSNTATETTTSSTETTPQKFYEFGGGESIQLLPNCQPNDIEPYNDKEKGLKRWSQRDHPSSDIESHFNCFREDTLCKYFYPADFFDTSCGIGKDYAHFTEEAEAMRKNRTLWNFMPAVGFPTLSMNHTCFHTKPTTSGRWNVLKGIRGSSASGLPSSTLTDIGVKTVDDEDGEYQTVCITERLSMLHVHKAGGSSFHEAFNYIMRYARDSSVLVRHKFFTPSRRPSYGPRIPLRPDASKISKGANQNNQESSGEKNDNNEKKKRRRMEEDRMWKYTREALTHATKYPQSQFEPEQHVIFAVVRDPIERFISSIGQALGGVGSTGNQIGKVLMQECVEGKETSKQALTCIAKYVQEYGFWIELHFTPQVLDMAFTTMFADVPISIFSFRDIKTVLNYFGAGNVQMRNGHQERYRASSILTEMSVDDFDEETLKIVCEIYKMDVIMQRSLGMEVERCDPFIPK